MANEQSNGVQGDDKLADYLARRRRRKLSPTRSDGMLKEMDNRVVKSLTGASSYFEAEEDLTPNEIIGSSYLQSKRSIKNSAKLLDDNENIIAANRITLLADEPNNYDNADESNKITNNEQQQQQQQQQLKTILPTSIPSRNGANIDKNQLSINTSQQKQEQQIRLDASSNSSSNRHQLADDLHKPQQQTSQTFSSTDLVLIVIVVILINKYFKKICHLLRLNSIVRLVKKSKRRPSEDDDDDGDELTAIKSRDCELTSTGKLAATFRRTVAKSSLVVASVDNATRPKVQLVTERLKRFVELDNGRVGEASSFKSWLGRQLATGTPPRATATTQPTTIEVTVHQTDRDDSLVGLAGSFIERANQSAPSTSVQSGSRTDQAIEQLNSLVQAQQPISPSLSDRPSLSQSLASTSSVSVNNLASNKPQTTDRLAPETPQFPGAGGDLARSKSQTNAAHNSSSYHLTPMGTTSSKSISPSQLRPCCSVSPSAMGRLACSLHARQQATSQLQHNHQHVGALIGRNQSADRARHRYESYYDDEHEDAYRRLTASIGMQFGLGYDDEQVHANCHHHHRQQTTTTTTSTLRQVPVVPACQCCSTTTAGMVASSGDTSDSGSFSLINAACSEPLCSMCSGEPQANTNMSILVQQPSLSTPPPPPPTNVSPHEQHRPSIGECPPAGYPLVARWNHRRRSTMSGSCSRSPRRMSVAAIGHWQPPSSQLTGATIYNNNAAIQQHHLMHRASIASDGSAMTTSSHFAGGLAHHHATGSAQHQPTGGQACPRAHPFSRQQSGIQTAQLSRTAIGSQYSSSAGSSSGIGFSGSQCTNTPTASAFPFGSFVATSNGNAGGYPQTELFGTQTQDLIISQKQLRCCDYDPSATLVYHQQQQQQQYQQQKLQQQQPHLTSCKLQAPMMCQSAGLLPPGSRKFSLPVQLESHAAERIRDAGQEVAQTSNLLFDMNLTQADDQQPVDELLPSGESAHQAVKAVDEQRRSSQTIARQSSFWLEDTSCSPAASNKSPPTHKSPASSSASSRPPSSTSSSSSTTADSHSPSPDSAAAAAVRSSKLSRSLNLGPSSTSSSISKRRLLGKLRSRRSNRRLGSSSSTRHNKPKDATAAANSTDDEQPADKPPVLAATPQSDHDTDQNSSLDRDFLAPTERRALADVNSASLERQCRELWKLRTTLHQDATLGDNWSNYHQRLNRRYDSGYKSIENQFSSSIEGSGSAAAMAAAVRNQSPTVRLEAGENEVFEQENQSTTSPSQEKTSDMLSRPQSGCSNFITTEPTTTTTTTARQQRTPTPLSNDEETK